jgi:hypothetical protein
MTVHWVYHQKPTEDLTGNTYRLVTVTGPAKSDGLGTRWKVRCECGAERIVRRGELVKKGGPKSHRSCQPKEPS